jgi:hypothetical protein
LTAVADKVAQMRLRSAAVSLGEGRTVATRRSNLRATIARARQVGQCPT